ncbi:hypothetical protein H6P81_006295 [Aristolochia fimbriata]|uniref:Aminotransferase-like plant mobile domain-containing protein n=1 Tax=Aristolochia fimbriata TaxID=158543 RepID=A0AAV7F0L8_ARIFI|nr:hypothetical protein H6P81_006295 [Aristolochia fimbriata]
MMYNVLGGNPRTDHISIWLMYTPVLDDVSLENGIGMVKHGFQSMLELFVKQDTYSYEMDSRRSLENVGGTGEGAVMVYGGQAPAEGDERVERPIAEFIPEEREPSEEANDNSSSEGSWPEPVTEEDVEEEEDVELPLPTMGVPPLDENDEPYPDLWIGVMDMDVVMANAPLLYDQDSHRSEAIWHGEDPGCLECTEHFQTLRHWPRDERMWPYVEAAGFGALHRVQWLRLDKPLITALVERWRSETNTFHLANGEMTITLEDVAVLLGLRVDGDAVTGSTRGDWMELARVFLGVKLPPGSFQGGRLSLSWLRGQFSFCPDDATELVIQQHAPAYLLHLVGAMIFLDGSARGVHMAYLTLFEDFEAAGRYNWGAATLAFLYRELPGWRSHGSRRYCWMPHPYAVVGVGTSTYWTPDTPRGTGATGWPFRFQMERPTDECHKPWWKLGAIQDRVGPPAELSGRRIWLSRTPLICFEIVELHVPDRVMLQFGLEQVTPPDDVENVTRISRKGRAGEDWALYHRDYIARWEARAEYVVMGTHPQTCSQ